MDALKYSKDCVYIFSYNSRGFADEKQAVCRDLMLNADHYFPILCNQENFLLHSNRYKVKQCLPNARIIFKKAVKENLSGGRPMNGMFIAVPDEIKEYVTDVSPSHWRVQAITLATPTNKILIINSYFPTDPKILEFDTCELLSTLSAINSVLEINDFDSVIWTGDINADFIRQTKFTDIMENFIDEKSLMKSWEKFVIDFTHSFECDDNCYVSTLDHFFWSQNMSSSIIKADVLHLLNNTSDHCPIYCAVQISSLHPSEAMSYKNVVKPSWKKASKTDKENYRVTLDSQLRSLTKPYCIDMCCDVHCCDQTHIDEIDTFLNRMLESITMSLNSCIPMTRSESGKKISRIANWNEDVLPYKDTAWFWHSVWQSAGRPINTELHRQMKRTRNLYHFQIRKNKKMIKTLKRNALLDACINGNGDIFDIIKKQRKTKTSLPTTIDGVSSNIGNHFANIYSQLYNSVNDDTELNHLRQYITERIDSSSLQDVLRITPELVTEAIGHLKNNKSDPTNQISSDALKNAPTILCEQLANLFKQFLIHGHVSSILMLSTLIPIIKDKLGDSSSSNNYRSIAISSLILKIFDWVILILHEKELGMDELQFGFQRKTSTNMCTWLVVESIDYFQRNGSDVYACVMDMSKAFDHVRHSTLFWKLIKKGISLISIRLLSIMYEKQIANVRWNNILSNTFPVKNGVKQGGVLSPWLYCAYIDDLFDLLRHNGTGCWVNGMFVGIVGYADDLLLLSPSLDGLQEMVNNCEIFARSHNLTFSTHQDPKKCKTKCMAFLKKARNLKNILLNGRELPWVNSSKHLGIRISLDIRGLTNDLTEKRAQFINKTNDLIQEFHFADARTKVKINNIFNSHFYGSSLWDLFSWEAERLEKTWNVSQRILLGIPRNTHRYFIEPLTETRHIIFSLYSRFFNFISSIAATKKSVLRNMLSVCKYDCLSTTGRNLRNIMLRVTKSCVDDIIIDDIKTLVYNVIPPGDEWKVNLAKEILDVKGRDMELKILNNAELDDILEQILT